MNIAIRSFRFISKRKKYINTFTGKCVYKMESSKNIPVELKTDTKKKGIE